MPATAVASALLPATGTDCRRRTCIRWCAGGSLRSTMKRSTPTLTRINAVAGWSFALATALTWILPAGEFERREDAATGREIWFVNVLERFRGVRPSYEQAAPDLASMLAAHDAALALESLGRAREQDGGAMTVKVDWNVDPDRWRDMLAPSALISNRSTS